MNWIWLNSVPLINIAGIILDIVGAFFVASEIVHQFKGKQYQDSVSYDHDIVFAPNETDDYKKWSHLKTFRMKIGLGLLTGGFILQIIANIMQLRNAT